MYHLHPTAALPKDKQSDALAGDGQMTERPTQSGKNWTYHKLMWNQMD